MADVPTRYFLGTAQTVINTGTDIAAGNFSGSPAATFNNTTDSAVPYATQALAMLEAPDWAAAPVAGTVVSLWGVLLNVDGTDDDTDMTLNFAQFRALVRAIDNRSTDLRATAQSLRAQIVAASTAAEVAAITWD